ncbi:MAG TPA: hypothetical protein VFG04_26065 [Planctomycetaceae bacterium]|jgi:hypothetical protein|nr:hypothetical protein [Planctomycetaceae bacterium]
MLFSRRLTIPRKNTRQTASRSRRSRRQTQRQPQFVQQSICCGLSVEELESRTLLSATVAVTNSLLGAKPTLVIGANLGPKLSPNIQPNTVAPINPSQMQVAYGINQISFNGIAGTGAGQTVAIVDAYNNPDIIADTSTFNTDFGLPQFNAGGPTFQVLNQTGGTTLPMNTNTTTGDWDIEEALDVQWVHSMAPQANIILFEANTNSFNDLGTAEATAAGWNGVSVVSNSWGGGEDPSETSVDSIFLTPTGHQGVTFLASTGDDGTPAGYPSFSPNVVAVGGTNLQIDSSGNYLSESVWNNNNGHATGGGISTVEAQPSYQVGKVNGLSSTFRTVPDVAADADPNTGVYVLDNWNEGQGGGFFQIGGTSLACPLWAGMIAVANQGRTLAGETSLNGLTQTLPMIYSLPSTDFHDITVGNNGTYSAGTGYDLVTGRGTPIANLVVPALAGYGTTAPSVSAPATASVAENTPFSFSTSGGNGISTTDPFSAGNVDSLTLSAAHGTVTLSTTTGLIFTSGTNSSATFTVSGTIANLNADLSNGVSYQPNNLYVGSDSLVVSLKDPGENLTGSASVAITVNAGSPPTVGAPLSIDLAENTSFAFTSPFVVGVVDSGTAEQLTLSVSHGALTLGTTTGLTVGGNGTASMVLTGSLSSLNSDLASLTYTPTANYIGPDTLNLSDTDTGDSLTGTATTAITVHSLLPEFQFPSGPAITIPENTLYQSPSIGPFVHIVDFGGSAENLTMTVSHGKLTLPSTTGLTVTGNGTATLNLVGSLQNVDNALAFFQYLPTVNYVGTDTLNFSDTDPTTSLTGTASATITIVGFALSAPATASTTQNASLTFSSFNGNQITATDGFASFSTDSLSVAVSNGTVTLGSTTGLTFVSGANGSSSLIVTGTISNLNAAVNNLTYVPTTNYVGPAALALSLKDPGQNLTTSASVAITVGGVAPIVSAPSILSMAENTSHTFTLSNGSVSVSDNGTAEQMTLSVSHGTLTLGTTTGLTVSGNGTASMILTGSLSSLDNDLFTLTYTPTTNYIGSDTLSVSDVDTSDGLTGTATTAITVNSLVPSFDFPFGPAITVPENGLFQSPISAPFVDVGDFGGTAENLTMTVSHGRIALGTTTGLTVTGNGTASVNLIGSINNLDNALGQLFYQPTTNYVGTDTLNFSDTDTTTHLTGTASAAITVVGFIVGAPASASTTQNTALTFSSANGNQITVTDAFSNASDGVSVTVSNGTVTLGSTTGLTFVGGANGTSSFTVNGTLGSLNAALNGLTYVPNAGYTGSDSMQVILGDSTYSINTGATVALTINAISAPTIAAPATATVSENGSLVFSAGNGNALSFTDNGAGNRADELTMSVSHGTLTLGPANGLIVLAGSNGSASFTVKGTVANLNTALAGVTYTPTTNYAGSDSLAILVNDPGDSLSGSTSVALTISPLAPALTAPATASLSENGSLIFSSGNGNAISATDLGPGPDSLTLTVTHGTLTLATTTGLTFTTGSNGTASFVVTGSVANLNAALNGLTYTPTAGYSGSDSLAVSLNDSGDSLSASKSVALTINGLAPPSITAPATVSVVQNGSLAFSSANGNAISASDAAAGSSSDSLTLTVTHGTLTLSTVSGLTFTSGTNGSAIFTVSGTIANLNAALNGLTYTPTAGYTGSDSLAISVTDPGDSETGSRSVAITVTAASPPTITAPSSASVVANGTLAFTSTNAISVADTGPGSGSDTLTLTVTHGTVTFASTAGLTFTAGTNGSASFTVTGSVANLNAALSGLTYKPTASYTGPDSLAILISDAADSLSASASVALTVNAGSTAPAITAPATATTKGASPFVFTTISISDPNAGGSVEQLSIKSTSGLLKLATTSGITFVSGTNNSASMVIDGTLAALNAALSGLTFTPATKTATLTLAYTDLGNGLSATATITVTELFGSPIGGGGGGLSISTPVASPDTQASTPADSQTQWKGLSAAVELLAG